MDRGELFLYPVNKAEVPDYFEVVRQPMCWLWIDEKLEKNEYLNIAAFKVICSPLSGAHADQDAKRDIHLVLDNAMLYNKGDSPFHRTAKRMQMNAQPLLDELDTITVQSPFSIPNSDSPPGPVKSDDRSEDAPGDLEPSPLLLQTLVDWSGDGSQRDHLASIFIFEFEKPRPPTPPPPSPPKPRERKYMSAAERKQRWEERQAAAKERANAGRSTRAVRALAKAFAEEAGVQPSSDAEVSGPSDRRMPSPQAGASSRRKRRDEALSTVEERSEAFRLPSKPQPGVAGVETVAVLSDKERRELEKQMDITTEQVDLQDLFTRFNVGWVLPEGSKRRRPERPPDPGASQQVKREYLLLLSKAYAMCSAKAKHQVDGEQASDRH